MCRPAVVASRSNGMDRYVEFFVKSLDGTFEKFCEFTHGFFTGLSSTIEVIVERPGCQLELLGDPFAPTAMLVD